MSGTFHMSYTWKESGSLLWHHTVVLRFVHVMPSTAWVLTEFFFFNLVTSGALFCSLFHFLFHYTSPPLFPWIFPHPPGAQHCPLWESLILYLQKEKLECKYTCMCIWNNIYYCETLSEQEWGECISHQCMDFLLLLL